MTENYTGSATGYYPVTIPLPEDGDDRSAAAYAAGMEALADRTAELDIRTSKSTWQVGSFVHGEFSSSATAGILRKYSETGSYVTDNAYMVHGSVTCGGSGSVAIHMNPNTFITLGTGDYVGIDASIGLRIYWAYTAGDGVAKVRIRPGFFWDDNLGSDGYAWGREGMYTIPLVSITGETEVTTSIPVTYTWGTETGDVDVFAIIQLAKDAPDTAEDCNIFPYDSDIVTSYRVTPFHKTSV